MKSIVALALLTFGFNTFAADCFSKNDAFKDEIINSLVRMHPSMATPDRTSPEYLEAYSAMSERLYANVKMLETVLDSVCDMQVAAIKKVRSLEIK